jgi:hypothetical protein
MRSLSFAFVALALSLAGCSDDADEGGGTQQDSGGAADTSIADTGSSPIDTGTEADGTTTDTGTATDTGTSTDTGSATDSGSSTDTGSPADSGVDSSPTSDATPTDECASEADCRIFDSYCTLPSPCMCIPLKKTAPNPTCSGTMISCFIAPCSGKKATCVSGKCAVAPAGGSM